VLLLYLDLLGTRTGVGGLCAFRYFGNSGGCGQAQKIILGLGILGIRASVGGVHLGSLGIRRLGNAGIGEKMIRTNVRENPTLIRTNVRETTLRVCWEPAESFLKVS